jgi:predicted amidophosphoribosyltransferase
MAEFRAAYGNRLEVKQSVRKYERILLVDDLCTHGNTLELAAIEIHRINPNAEVFGVTAGQMIGHRLDVPKAERCVSQVRSR